MPFEITVINSYMGNKRKPKTNENINVNFNQSQEIAYWAKRYNISPEIFRKRFEETGNSISKTLAIILGSTGSALQ
jgi:hypothetical protein